MRGGDPSIAASMILIDTSACVEFLRDAGASLLHRDQDFATLHRWTRLQLA